MKLRLVLAPALTPTLPPTGTWSHADAPDYVRGPAAGEPLPTQPGDRVAPPLAPPPSVEAPAGPSWAWPVGKLWELSKLPC